MLVPTGSGPGSPGPGEVALLLGCYPSGFSEPLSVWTLTRVLLPWRPYRGPMDHTALGLRW